jgi:hypothetical protein
MKPKFKKSFRLLDRYERRNPGIGNWTADIIVQWLVERPCTAPGLAQTAFPTYEDNGLVYAVICDLVDRGLVRQCGWVKDADVSTKIFIHRDFAGTFCAHCARQRDGFPGCFEHNTDDCDVRPLERVVPAHKETEFSVED